MMRHRFMMALASAMYMKRTRLSAARAVVTARVADSGRRGTRLLSRVGERSRGCRRSVEGSCFDQDGNGRSRA
jgi:hypothetical protein